MSYFKTQGSAVGIPYDFLLKRDVQQAVDDTLAPGDTQAKCKRLVGVEVGGPQHEDRAGLQLPTDSKISFAFAKAGLIYNAGKSGELKPTSPGPLGIRHAQVVAKYEN